MTSDLAPEGPPAPPVLSTQDRRVAVVWSMADKFATNAVQELALAQSLRGGPGTGVNARETMEATEEGEKLRKMQRNAVAAARDSWKCAIETARYAKELESLVPPADGNLPVDPATQALIEQKQAREEAERKIAMAGSALSS